MSKLEVMVDKIKTHDIEYFKDAINDFYDSPNLDEVKQEIQKTLNINNTNDLVIEIQKQFDGNYIKNNLSRILYKMLVNENEKDRKIGLSLNRYFGKAKYKKNNKKAFKYRKIDSDKEVIFSIGVKEEPIIIFEDTQGKQVIVDNFFPDIIETSKPII